jgi:predicted RNA binding protein YcfA (HicA-like mRNA interferase family)
MKVRDLLKRLAEDGWIEVKSGGTSHRKFKHPTKPGHVTARFTVATPISRSALKSVLKAAGLE